MGLDSRPQPGRLPISAAQAAKFLHRDARTVQRMITDGELEGGCQQINKRQRWFVYADQLTEQGQSRELAADVASLRTEVAAAKADAAAAHETNRLLLANQAILLSALEDYKQASEEIAAAADEYRSLNDRHRNAASRFRDSADGFAAALGNYRDIIGQFTAPSDISTLGASPEKPL